MTEELGIKTTELKNINSEYNKMQNLTISRYEGNCRSFD
jgi:hypothetical protein